jgi:hypothetical protein
MNSADIILACSILSDTRVVIPDSQASHNSHEVPIIAIYALYDHQLTNVTQAESTVKLSFQI